MKGPLLTTLLLVAAHAVHAAPATYVYAEYATDVITGVDAASDTDSAAITIPPGAADTSLPITAVVSHAGPNPGDDAAATAIADTLSGQGSLIAQAEVGADSGNGTFVDAFSSTSFFGVFSGAGTYMLTVDFTNTRNIVVPGSNDAGAELSLRLDAGFDTLIDTTFSANEQFTYEFMLDEATEGVIDLFLFSDAFATSGRISNTASANFWLDVTPTPVPLPSALLPFAGLLAGLGIRRRTARC